jgi:predicted nucleic acid-binding protein
MSDKYFVDTNILIYAHDKSAGSKHTRARKLINELWESGRGVLSVQVLQEMSVNLRRKAARPKSLDQVRALIRDYATWEIVPATARSVLKAIEVEARYRMSFWDAMILVTAEDGGVAVLYFEDLAAGQRYGSILVVNPLLDQALSKSKPVH